MSAFNAPTEFVPPTGAGAGKPPANRLVDRLRDMTLTLAEFGVREERQFLFIGDRLGSIYSTAREIVSRSERIVADLVSEEGDGATVELRVFLEGLEAHIEGVRVEAERQSESLSSLIVDLGRIEQPLQSLVKVVKVLQALSFSTRVESTHGQSGQTLQVLADNLKDLATKISTKTDEVRDRLHGMAALADAARERMKTLETESLVHARSTLHQARLHLDLITERRRHSLDGARLISQHSQDITAAIGEVVSSIQFHDITRQQIEHVRAALVELEEECANGGEGESPRHSVVGICRVQAAQLRHTPTDLFTGVVRIVKSLQDIALSVGHLSRQMRSISGGAEREGATYFVEIESIIASVTAMLQESSGESQGAFDAVTAVLAAMKELGLLLGEIELIGTEMKLIAFNAGITAAHNMERGAGLGVIADSIQSLSGQVLARTREFAEGYRHVEHLVQRLSDTDVAGDRAESDRTLAERNRQSVALIERLRETNRGLVGMLRDLDGRSTSIGEEIKGVADGITVHHDASRVIDRLLADIEALTGEHDEGDVATGDGRAVFDRLSQRYTMQSEREIHLRVSGEADAGTPRRPAGKSRGSEFGANIELF